MSSISIINPNIPPTPPDIEDVNFGNFQQVIKNPLLGLKSKELSHDSIMALDEINSRVLACSAMIAKAMEILNTADDGLVGSTMPADMLRYFKDNGLSVEETDAGIPLTKDMWDNNIKSLNNHLEDLVADFKLMTKKTSEYLDMYYAYITGATSSTHQSNQTIRENRTESE
jgi:hypothetical protein